MSAAVHWHPVFQDVKVQNQIDLVWLNDPRLPHHRYQLFDVGNL
jgi:hypothetical protein